MTDDFGYRCFHHKGYKEQKMRLNLFKTLAFYWNLVKLYEMHDFYARKVCFITQKRLYL